jgi:hypothetical protein
MIELLYIEKHELQDLNEVLVVEELKVMTFVILEKNQE